MPARRLPISGLKLTPEEWNLYHHHYMNLNHGGGIQWPSGEVSTVLQASEPLPSGQWANIPTVWNGQALNEDQAMQMAGQGGMGQWPTYPSQAEAEARYQAMHGYMEQDVQHMSKLARALLTQGTNRK